MHARPERGIVTVGSLKSGEREMATPVLEIRDLSKSLGTSPILRDVNLSLFRGARHGLIGPNGAGKTSLFKLITGLYQPSSGSILFCGEDITQLSQGERKQRGVARSFRLSREAQEFTVLENVCMAFGGGDAGGSCLAHDVRKGEILDRAVHQLERLTLAAAARKPVRELPAAGQRLMEIAIALAQRPQLLLLDEPTDGVAPDDVTPILDVICQLDCDVTCMIIEHKLDVLFQTAQRITVLVGGAVLLEASADELATRLRDREQVLSQFSLTTLQAMNQVVGEHLADRRTTAGRRVPPVLA